MKEMEREKEGRKTGEEEGTGSGGGGKEKEKTKRETLKLEKVCRTEAAATPHLQQECCDNQLISFPPLSFFFLISLCELHPCSVKVDFCHPKRNSQEREKEEIEKDEKKKQCIKK